MVTKQITKASRYNLTEVTVAVTGQHGATVTVISFLDGTRVRLLQDEIQLKVGHVFFREYDEQSQKYTFNVAVGAVPANKIPTILSKLVKIIHG